MTVKQPDDRLERKVESEKRLHEAKRNAAEWMWYTFLKEKKKERARPAVVWLGMISQLLVLKYTTCSRYMYRHLRHQPSLGRLIKSPPPPIP